MPKFSVLLPTHAHPQTLPFAIQSFLQQTETDFELLVVGDGCDRTSAEIVRSFDDARIRFYDLPKASGVGYANRNIALKEAAGEIIVYGSDDDVVFPNHLSNMDNVLKNPAVKWGYCRPLFVNIRGFILPECVNLSLPQPRRYFLDVANMLPAGCIAHRRQCFDEVSYWPEEKVKAGDYALWQRFLKHYGVKGMGFSRRPTMMHFNKDGRSVVNAQVWPRWLASLNLIAETSSSWPSILRLQRQPSDERLLQEIAFERIAGDKRYPARISEGVSLLLDHLAWCATKDPALL